MAVAPEVPAAGLFTVGLIAGLAALLIVLLRFAAITIVGSLLRWLGDALSFIPFGGGWAQSKINNGINYVDDALGRAAAASERAAVAMLHDSWKLTLWAARSLEHLATETLHGFQTVATHTVPAAIAARLAPVVARLEGLEGRVADVQRRTLAELERGIDRLTARGEAIARAADARIAAAKAAVLGTLAADLAAARREALGRVDGLRESLTHRIGKVEKAVGLTALTGVVVGIVARELPWIRCRNVGRVGKALCGSNVQQMENLIGEAIVGATVIAGSISVVALARECQTFTRDVDDALRFFVRELR